MRPPRHQRMLGGRFVFAALSVLIAWQMHITAAGMNVPAPVVVVAVFAMFGISMTTVRRDALLLAALAVQALVHFGSALPMFAQNCHDFSALTIPMAAAHVFAAAAGWALMAFSEDLIAYAQQLVARPLLLRQSIVISTDLATHVVAARKAFTQVDLLFEIGSRAPPQYV